MTLAGEGDAARWDAAALETVRDLELGRPVFAPHCSAVTYGPVRWQGVDRATGTLEAHLNAAVNRAFADDELPIRFFVLPLTDRGHAFGAVYDHWIADSRAMRELMRRVYLRYSRKGVAGLPRLTVNAPSMRESYGRKLGAWPSLTALSVATQALVRHSRCHRMNLTDPVDVSSRVLVRELRPGLIERVHAFAKARAVSVNDVFLGVLGQVMGEHTAADRYQARVRLLPSRRNQVGLGTIMDIRAAANQDLDHVFGLYLSNYVTFLKRPEATPLAQQVERIGHRTREMKQKGQVVRAFSSLKIARTNWILAHNQRAQALNIHKLAPTVAGISNVNMTGSWADGGQDGEVVDYLRTGPTGPLVPLVLTLTTIGSRLHLSMTYRTTAFDDAEARRIIEAFGDRLAQVGEPQAAIGLRRAVHAQKPQEGSGGRRR